MADTSYFEVRCEHCKTSFAPGTRQCIHCGGALGRRLLGFGALGGERTPAQAPERQVAGADAGPSLGSFVRIAMIALFAVSVLARACLGQD